MEYVRIFVTGASTINNHCVIRTADVTGTVSLPDGVEMVMPGDNATLHIELIAPVALTEGLRFALREGGKTVGAGVVSKITG